MTPPMNLRFGGLDPFFPIAQIYREIETRLKKLSISVSLEMLLNQGFAAEARKPRHAETLPGTTVLRESAGGMNRLQRAGLTVLARAALTCERARKLQPKNFRALLEEALDLLKQFDTLSDVFEELERSTLAARSRGGAARQAKLEPARRRAARLLLIKAPPNGWNSPAHAARTIEPFLAAFVSRRRLAMVGVRRTVVGWIHNHPLVSAAYDKRCASRNS